MRFRDNRQIAKCNRILCRTMHALRDMWTVDGPSDEACRLAEANGGPPLSSGERVMLLATFALWNSGGGVTFADVVHFLHGERLASLAALILAAAEGAEDIDEWISVEGYCRADGCDGEPPDGETMCSTHRRKVAGS